MTFAVVLAPYSHSTADALEVVHGMPDAQRQPRLLEEMIGGLADPYTTAEG
jgi:hypothetical protein